MMTAARIAELQALLDEKNMLALVPEIPDMLAEIYRLRSALQRIADYADTEREKNALGLGDYDYRLDWGGMVRIAQTALGGEK